MDENTRKLVTYFFFVMIWMGAFGYVYKKWIGVLIAVGVYVGSVVLAVLFFYFGTQLLRQIM